MVNFQDILKINKSSNVPVYLQLTNELIHQIRCGRLRKGLKLPGSRILAEQLSVNRMTVVAAYDELQAQGWIDQKPRKGSFIRDELPVLMPKSILGSDTTLTTPDSIPFEINKNLIGIPHLKAIQTEPFIIDDGFPDPRLAPIEELTRCIRGLTKVPSYKKYLLYTETQGNTQFREVLAHHLND